MKINERGEKMSSENENIIDFLKCISDNTRFKILKLIAEDTLCVCELTEILDRTQPCISQHMARFKKLNLVNEKKDKQWSYYSLNNKKYNEYLKTLNNLKNLDFKNLGLNNIEKKYQETKSKDLCNIKNN